MWCQYASLFMLMAGSHNQLTDMWHGNCWPMITLGNHSALIITIFWIFSIVTWKAVVFCFPRQHSVNTKWGKVEIGPNTSGLDFKNMDHQQRDIYKKFINQFMSKLADFLSLLVNCQIICQCWSMMTVLVSKIDKLTVNL